MKRSVSEAGTCQPLALNVPKAHPPVLKAHLPALKAHLPALKAHPPALEAHLPALKAHPPALKAHPPALKALPPELKIELRSLDGPRVGDMVDRSLSFTRRPVRLSL